MRDLVCLRSGEPANDPRQGGTHPLERELIKIRGKEGSWECVYFASNPTACSIYEHRPLECRSLSCTDTGEIFLAMDTPIIDRREYVAEGSALWECIVEHDRLFPVAEAVRMAQQESGCSELDRIIRHEMNFRQILAEKVGASDEELWAYFGRPLWMVLLPLDSRMKRYGLEEKFMSKC
jgi:Fe-S-cluster containining protein